MKGLLVVLAAVAAVLAILGPNGVVVAQKGAKTTSTELSAVFDDDLNGVSAAIKSDGKGAYTSNSITSGYPNDIVLLPSGALYMRIQQNRQLIFEFTNRIPRIVPTPPEGKVICRQWAPAGYDPEYFTVDAPPLDLPGTPPNDFTAITTGGSWTKVNGQWAYSTATFNLKTMAAGQTAYVSLSFNFHFHVEGSSSDESYYARHGFDWWLNEGRRTDVVRVTCSTDSTGKRTWALEPVPADVTDAPPHGLDAYQAGLYFLGETRVGKVRMSGTCYLGDWVMPFKLTLTER